MHSLLRRPLVDNWVVSAAAGPVPDGLVIERVPAKVPGVVHLDLQRNGIVDDPFDGDNESDQTWIGRVDWKYEKVFEWNPGDFTRYDLVAEGLDTLAAVHLNGLLLGRTQNQHRSYRFDLRDALKPGPNLLVICFRAPVEEAEKRSLAHGRLPHVNHHPYNTLRKSASNFGWDWGIDVTTSGIWKWIGIEAWSGARVASVTYQTSVSDAPDPTGVLEAVVSIERDGIAALPVVVHVDFAEIQASATIPVGDDTTVVELRQESVRLWWPRGHGEQALYDVAIRIESNELPDVVCVHRTRVGFRTIELRTAPDANGSPFDLYINGRLVRVRGANWIPDHAFVTEVDEARYRRRISDAVEANLNLLRVWGGGIYESEAFYSMCDEEGILVWQDFLFACAAYAEEEWLSIEVEAEAREQIARLSPHVSLVIWNGSNETIWLRMEEGWRPEIAGRTWGEGYYRSLLPTLLNELDPTRAYSPSSPHSFDDYLYPNDPNNGTVHIWDVWNVVDYLQYRSYAPRFVAEFGFQGPPAWSTLEAVVHDDPIHPYGPQMLVHQKAADGNLKLDRGMSAHLPPVEGIHDWHWATQLNQAHAVRFGIEHFRSLSPLNSGAIVWQLNDNWPVISWSAVDFNEHRKPLWFALRAAFAPRLATFQPRAGRLALILVNDTAEPWNEQVIVSRRKFNGQVIVAEAYQIDVPPWGEHTVALAPHLGESDDPSREVVTARVAGERIALWDFAEVRDQILRRDAINSLAQRVADRHTISVTACDYVRDLFLQVDRVDTRARVDEGMISLMPGETVDFTVTGCGHASPQAFLDPLVLRSANDLVV